MGHGFPITVARSRIQGNGLAVGPCPPTRTTFREPQVETRRLRRNGGGRVSSDMLGPDFIADLAGEAQMDYVDVTADNKKGVADS